MKREQLTELLYQGLETELGGSQVYETALRCVQNDELKEEWEEYLEQTKTHIEIMRGLFETVGLDPGAMTPGRAIVRHIGESLVKRWKWPSKPVHPKPPSWSRASALWRLRPRIILTGS